MHFIDYFLIFVSSFVGVGLNVTQEMGKIQNENKQLTAWQTVRQFFKADWVTLFQSAFAIIFGILVLIIALRFLAAGKYVDTIVFILMIKEVVFACLGYMGQKWIYKGFGTADKYVNKKLDKDL